MTLVVPFDGSELSEAALVRATEFATVFEEEVLAVSVVPKGNTTYARDHGWIPQDEDFDLERVVAGLHRQVTDRCPGADFRHKLVDRHAPSGAIASRIRSVARDEDASMVFIGSENAGRLVTSVSSVGRSVAAEDAYDVVIVRHKYPSRTAELREASPHRRGNRTSTRPGESGQDRLLGVEPASRPRRPAPPRARRAT